jgi:hypothetical protein
MHALQQRNHMVAFTSAYRTSPYLHAADTMGDLGTGGAPAADPVPSYSAPAAEPAPMPSFSAPAADPVPSYSAPATDPTPTPSYSAPAADPVPSYSAPATEPVPSYSTPAADPVPSYSAPAAEPATSYSAPAADTQPALDAQPAAATAPLDNTPLPDPAGGADTANPVAEVPAAGDTSTGEHMQQAAENVTSNPCGTTLL